MLTGISLLLEGGALAFFVESTVYLSEDTVFLSVYGIFSAFFCLAYAHYLRINHLKEKS